MRDVLQNIALLVLSTVVALAVAEVLARQLTHFPIHSPVSNRVFDERLLYRMDRNVEGIDRNGFRNPESHAREFPPIAALGDSQTYAYNATRETSWPGHLEAVVGAPVYNFGVGSYNVLQYAETARMAAESGARTIVVGLYLHNDLYFCNVARLSHWIDTLFRDETRRRQLKEHCGFEDAQLNNTSRRIMLEGARKKKKLATRSALYSLGRYVVDTVLPRRDNIWRYRFRLSAHDRKGNNLARCAKAKQDFAFEIDGYTDVVTHAHFSDLARQPDILRQRGAFLDGFLDDLFGKMATDAGRTGAKILIVTIPSRLRVVHRFLTGGPAKGVTPPPWVDAGAAGEAQLTAFVAERARRHGIATFDLTEAVAAAYGGAVARGEVFYPCRDSHPLPDGYAAYARAMAPQVKALMPLP